MAGIGVKLNSIFEKQSIAADLVGFAYSTAVTVAPMFVVILDILLMGYVLGFDEVGYMEREMFSCTILYTFIFSLLTTSPFNAVLSKYMQDVIYEERYQDILPCFYLGLVMNLGLSCLVGAPFCLWEHFVGGVEVHYVFTGFCAFISLVMVFYSMIYLSICKDYQRISIYFLLGMIEAFLLSLVLRFLCHWSIGFSMLFALMTGFFLTAILEFATIKRYFRQNSNRYKPVLRYFTRWWQLIVTNFFYILGLYIHNFVFWTSDMRMVLVKSFVCNQPYDMATCLAMFTNISATILFIARVEMHFHEKYKAYSEAVIGGKGVDIENAKRRMFRQLVSELMTLVRIQFIISVVVYLVCTVMLPQLGFAGLIMRIYPSLAVGYFILFLMYAAILFLYYFNDMAGSVMTTCAFCAVTLVGSMIATRLPDIWYGVGLIAGTFTGWTVAYLRIRWVEKHLASHIFCRGILLKQENVPAPSSKVYDKYALTGERQ
ncbi:MAG: exopolysaccharide Pel transporter PelG [Firmicutes bacterium]|jgi:uncharacterized membrane protein|nr:exopolysaccharide Pel transporter PelG [Bacillota bacterium]